MRIATDLFEWGRYLPSQHGRISYIMYQTAQDKFKYKGRASPAGTLFTKGDKHWHTKAWVRSVPKTEREKNGHHES